MKLIKSQDFVLSCRLAPDFSNRRNFCDIAGLGLVITCASGRMSLFKHAPGMKPAQRCWFLNIPGDQDRGRII